MVWISSEKMFLKIRTGRNTGIQTAKKLLKQDLWNAFVFENDLKNIQKHKSHKNHIHLVSRDIRTSHSHCFDMCSQFHRFPSGRNPLLSILCNLLGFVFVFVRPSSNQSLVLSEQPRYCRDLNDVTLVETSFLGVGVSCCQNMQDRLKLWQMAKVVEVFLQLPKYQKYFFGPGIFFSLAILWKNVSNHNQRNCGLQKSHKGWIRQLTIVVMMMMMMLMIEMVWMVMKVPRRGELGSCLESLHVFVTALGRF